MKSGKRRLVAWAVAPAAFMLAACGSSSGSTASTTPSTTPTTAESTPAASTPVPESPKMVIGMPGNPPIYSATIFYIAEKQGFFTKHGATVELKPFSTSADIGRALTSNQIAGGFMGTTTAISLAGSGSPVVSIFGLEHPDYVIATTDPAVTDCMSLKGKSVAVDAPGAPLDLALQAMLESCGLTESDVTAHPIGGTTQASALVSGAVKTAVAHIDTVANVEAQGVKVRSVLSNAATQPLAHYDALLTTKSQLQDPAARAGWVAVTAALHDAAVYMNDPQNADAVAQVAADDVTKEPLAVTKIALPEFLKINYWPTDGNGLPQASIEFTIQQQVKAGNVPADKAPTYADFVDSSVYADAVK